VAQAKGIESNLELFGDFVSRLARGLAARVEGGVESTAAETAPVERDALGNEHPGGALVARTAWTRAEEAHSGCFFWLGNPAGLLGGGVKPTHVLTADEVAALDASLRLNVEEGGEDDIALQWTALEVVPPDQFGTVLRESGIPSSTRATRIGIRIAGTDYAFLFFEAPGAADADALEPAPAADPAAAAPQAPVESIARPSPAPGIPGTPDPEHLRHLLDVQLPLTIRLGSTRMTLEEVLRLVPGSVVELDQRDDQPLEVLANGRTIARGEVVVVDERFGLRITELAAATERVAAAR
jgi:flagellar motor switch protein FliN/FliY